MNQFILNSVAIESIVKEEIDYILLTENVQKEKKARSFFRRRDRGYALNEMELISDLHFTRMFRLNRLAFNSLLNKISPLISGRALYAALHHPHEIAPKTKLAATLRWLAGGSYLDICFAFGIGISTFFKQNGVLWPTIAAIDQVIPLGFPINDLEKLNEISEGFSTYCFGRVKGCVMALDGWVCRTRCPTKKEVKNQMCYRNRKGMWGMVVFAGCDHQCKFLMLSVKCPGSTNDSLAWKLSDLHALLSDDQTAHALFGENNFFVVCDEAVPSNEIVLSPFGGRGIGIWKDSFNYHLSAMRQCIERAFGMLTRRWGIFWRPLNFDHARWPLVITVCGKLHNFCIEFGIGEVTEVPSDDIRASDELNYYTNEYNPDNFPIILITVRKKEGK